MKSESTEQCVSYLLAAEEAELVLSLLGNRCQALAMAVIQLFLTDPPQHTAWRKHESGVLCLVKDNQRRSYFLRLYCILRRQLLWEHEVYNDLDYSSPRPFLHTFEGEDAIVAFNFASEEEARQLRNVLLEKLEANKRRQERRNRQSVSSFHQHSHKQVSSQVSTGESHLSNGMVPVAKQKPHTTASGGRRKEKESKRRLTKADIGLPQDFRHVSHVGWDPNKGFDVDNVEDPQLKQFFEKAGVSDSQLQDRETREFIYDFINRHGGLDAESGVSDSQLQDRETREFIHDFHFEDLAVKSELDLTSTPQTQHIGIPGPPSPCTTPTSGVNNQIRSALTPPPPPPRPLSITPLSPPVQKNDSYLHSSKKDEYTNQHSTSSFHQDSHTQISQGSIEKKPLFKNIIKQKSNSAASGGKKTEKGSKQRLREIEIGLPKNFRREFHVGWDPNKGFNVDNIEDPVLKQFFVKAGVSDSQLQDRETREFIFDFINRHGSMNAENNELVLPSTSWCYLGTRSTDVQSPRPAPRTIINGAKVQSDSTLAPPPFHPSPPPSRSTQPSGFHLHSSEKFEITNRLSASSFHQDSRTQVISQESSRVRHLSNVTAKSKPFVASSAGREIVRSLSKSDGNLSSDFKHVSRVGLVSTKRFDYSDEESQLKQFLVRKSTSDRQLQYRESREFVLGNRLEDLAVKNELVLPSSFQTQHIRIRPPVPTPRTLIRTELAPSSN